MEEIKEEVNTIVSNMKKCFDIIWSKNLEESYQAIVIESTDEINYNGWFERLIELQEKLNK